MFIVLSCANTIYTEMDFMIATILRQITAGFVLIGSPV